MFCTVTENAKTGLFSDRAFGARWWPLDEFSDGECWYAESGDSRLFSVGRQLLSATPGRERLSHKKSSNWALLGTGWLPRWR